MEKFCRIFGKKVNLFPPTNNLMYTKQTVGKLRQQYSQRGIRSNYSFKEVKYLETLLFIA